MTIEKSDYTTPSTINNGEAFTLAQKFNPPWWFAVALDNPKPSLKEWLRNPFENFTSFFIGVKDRNFTRIGTAPLAQATMYDAGTSGWKWALCYGMDIMSPVWGIVCLLLVIAASWIDWKWALLLPMPIMLATGVLPFVSYAGKYILFYIGWRASSGAFGIKVTSGHDTSTPAPVTAPATPETGATS